MKFCFRRNCDMDERQLFMRGNVFQHTAILYMVLLVVNGWLKDCGVNWAPGMQENLIIFWLGVDLALCEYILRDITPKGSRNDRLYLLQGIFGMLLTGSVLLEILVNGSPVIADGMLTRNGGYLVCGLLMLVIFFTYLFKRLYDRRQTVVEDE